MTMTADDITELFTRSDGQFVFARWARPIVPVVFGVEDTTLSIVKGAIEAVVTLAGHKMAETDPEIGANLMFFFFREWRELPEVPNLDRLITDLVPLVERLQQADANQYRVFRFDENGAIKACFVFLRMDKHLASVSADTLALGQVVQSVLLWSDTAFRNCSPLARIDTGATILRPDIADLIRASYDPTLPDAETNAAHALRLEARIGRIQ